MDARHQAAGYMLYHVPKGIEITIAFRGEERSSNRCSPRRRCLGTVDHKSGHPAAAFGAPPWESFQTRKRVFYGGRSPCADETADQGDPHHPTLDRHFLDHLIRLTATAVRDQCAAIRMRDELRFLGGFEGI